MRGKKEPLLHLRRVVRAKGAHGHAAGRAAAMWLARAAQVSAARKKKGSKCQSRWPATTDSQRHVCVAEAGIDRAVSVGVHACAAWAASPLACRRGRSEGQKRNGICASAMRAVGVASCPTRLGTHRQGHVMSDVPRRASTVPSGLHACAASAASARVCR